MREQSGDKRMREFLILWMLLLLAYARGSSDGLSGGT